MNFKLSNFGELRNTALHQFWRLISGPFIIFLVPVYLSSEEQGYWYLIISVGAIAAFADFGFSTILMQFSAHEFAFLKFNTNNEIEGVQESKSKLSSLFIFACKWTGIVTAVMLPVTYAIGFLLLGNSNTEVDWKLPWLLYNIGAFISFGNSIVLSFFEGCDSVKQIQGKRLKISIVSTGIIIFCLLFNYGLLALSIGLLVSSIYGAYILYRRYSKNIHDFYVLNSEYYYNWGPEIFVLLRRYIISWSSGYIIFQLFTPIMFHFHGAIEAGKLGMSIAIFTAIFSVSNIWTTSIIPKINISIAKSEFLSLNKIFNRHFTFTIITYLFGSLTFYFVYFTFRQEFEFFERLLGIKSLFLLNLGWFAQLIVHNLSIYLRSHKEEPLLLPSILSAGYVCCSTYLAGRYLSIDFFLIGFVTLFLWLLPWVILIFRRKKISNALSLGIH
jgi:hypothetical protein